MRASRWLSYLLGHLHMRSAVRSHAKTLCMGLGYGLGMRIVWNLKRPGISFFSKAALNLVSILLLWDLRAMIRDMSHQAHLLYPLKTKTKQQNNKKTYHHQTTTKQQFLFFAKFSELFIYFVC